MLVREQLVDLLLVVQEAPGPQMRTLVQFTQVKCISSNVWLRINESNPRWRVLVPQRSILSHTFDEVNVSLRVHVTNSPQK